MVLDGRLYGKPRDAREARAHWNGCPAAAPRLERAGAPRGRERAGRRLHCTSVTFRRLDERTVDWYLESGEWRDRAGSYAIQGRGAALVERIEGDYWNVVGLPVSVLTRLLQIAG